MNARIVAPLLLALSLPLSVPAAGYSSGSNGSMSALEVTGVVTLAVPPDGVFHFTTITVTQSGDLRFTPNSRNTPVYLLATGDVTIGGFVRIDGAPSAGQAGAKGGPGGFAGGDGGAGAQAPADDHGPGRGLASPDCGDGGAGAFGARPTAPTTLDGTVYGGPLLTSLVGGSGGGGCPNMGGGGGGGAILIASDTKIQMTSGNYAFITATGGSGSSTSAGSGGAIHLVAPIVSGTGNLVVTSPNSGHGRIRVDSTDTSGMNFSFQPPAAATVGRFMRGYVPPTTQLAITHVAGTDIAGDSGAVELTLPFGSSTTQPVTIRATGFTGVVGVDLVVVPDSGPSTIYPVSFDMSIGDPRFVTTMVTLPVNLTTRIEAWAR